MGQRLLWGASRKSPYPWPPNSRSLWHQFPTPGDITMNPPEGNTALWSSVGDILSGQTTRRLLLSGTSRASRPLAVAFLPWAGEQSQLQCCPLTPPPATPPLPRASSAHMGPWVGAPQECRMLLTQIPHTAQQYRGKTASWWPPWGLAVNYPGRNTQQRTPQRLCFLRLPRRGRADIKSHCLDCSPGSAGG